MKTIEEHKQSGTYRADRHDKKAGTGLDELPQPPQHLNELEQQTFIEICERLNDNDCLTNSDLYVIECFSIQLNLLRQAKKELEGQQLVSPYTNKAGATNNSPSPWVAIIQKSSDQLLKLSAKLGLNPVDRAKQTKTNKPQDDPDSLLN